MKFLKPILAILAGYVAIKFGIPYVGSLVHPGTWPVVPTSVLKMYMAFVTLGIVMAYTFDEEGYAGLIGPIEDIYSNPSKAIVRYVVVLLVGTFGAYITYEYVKPTFDAPIELRSVHPAPPSNAKMWGKTYQIQTIQNPYREDKENFAKNLEEGGIVYYKNCFFCHGDRMLGRGHYAVGFNPRPANFVDVGTIAQLTESFVFWRIGTGGPGLPSEGTPWLSAMPVWHNLISEEEAWKVILFLYDYTGHSPRVTTKVEH